MWITNVHPPCDDKGHGGGVLNYGTTWIAYSTIHDNRARAGQPETFTAVNGGHGGGIYNVGTLTVTNSTISNNAAGDGAFGFWPHGQPNECVHGGEGGGIANVGTLTLENSTVTDNAPGTSHCPLNGTYDVPSFPGHFGGIYTSRDFNQGPPVTFVKNSIIAGNEVSDCGGKVISQGYNLIQTPGNCTVTGDFMHWAAYLGPLQDNGGPTLTHALNPNSPAIDAGSCTDTAGITVTMDQRGVARPQGEACDIGAYESPYMSTFTIRDIDLPFIGH